MITNDLNAGGFYYLITVIVVVPNPATPGLKFPVETPFPVYVPPAGEPPARANAGV